MIPAEELIQYLDLHPHPEGGYYRETYRAAARIAELDRSYATAIYFLLKSDQVSAFHRIKSDEIWHFYRGSSLTIHVINDAGEYQPLNLGPGAFQRVVSAGSWFGATVDEPDSFALVGCTVAPGFDFADFEPGDQETLLKQFPQHAELIKRLTK